MLTANAQAIFCWVFTAPVLNISTFTFLFSTFSFLPKQGRM